MNVRKQPCEQCPWRTDTPRGQFPAERYAILRETTGEKGQEAPPHAPMFGCHKSSGKNTMPCAGWLASVGYHSLNVRLAVSTGAIPMEALVPGDDWPPLFESYEEMAEAQGLEPVGHSVCLTKGCRDFAVPQTVVPGYPCPTCGRGKMIDVSDVIERRRQAGEEV